MGAQRHVSRRLAYVNSARVATCGTACRVTGHPVITTRRLFFSSPNDIEMSIMVVLAILIAVFVLSVATAVVALFTCVGSRRRNSAVFDVSVSIALLCVIAIVRVVTW